MLNCKIHLFRFFFFCLVFCSACIEPISFTGEDEGEPLLVVFGTLKTGNTASYITLRETQETGGPAPKITTARVFVREENGATQELFPDATESYYFFPNAELTPETGRAYSLEIILNNGEVYQTDPQIMPPPVPSSVGSVEIANFRGTAFAKFDFTSTSTPIYLRIPYDEFYSFPEIACGGLDPTLTCYFYSAPDLRRMPLADNDMARIQDTVLASVYSFGDFASKGEEYRGRHYYNLYPHSISEQAFEYWQDINKISNAQGSIFDPAPAAVVGNVYLKGNSETRALGFFEVAQTDTLRPFLLPSDFVDKVFIPPYCPVDVPPPLLPFGEFPFECCNCFRFPNAIGEKPDWF